MDQDNPGTHGLLTSLTADALRAARAESLQQLGSAMCLTAIGFFLAILGLLGLSLKLGRLIKCCLLFAAYPLIYLLFDKKRIQKFS
jgi:hypothetical protein